MDFVQEVVSSEPGASTVDDRVDNVLGGGQVGAPVKFEHVTDLQVDQKQPLEQFRPFSGPKIYIAKLRQKNAPAGLG